MFAPGASRDSTRPDVKKIGLLYDVGQDSSTTAIQEAKDYLDKEGIEYVERTGTDTAEKTTGVSLPSVADCIRIATGVATPTIRSTLSA